MLIGKQPKTLSKISKKVPVPLENIPIGAKFGFPYHRNFEPNFHDQSPHYNKTTITCLLEEIPNRLLTISSKIKDHGE